MLERLLKLMAFVSSPLPTTLAATWSSLTSVYNRWQRRQLIVVTFFIGLLSLTIELEAFSKLETGIYTR